VTGQADNEVGRLKLKGMTAFLTESSWWENAMRQRYPGHGRL